MSDINTAQWVLTSAPAELTEKDLSGAMLQALEYGIVNDAPMPAAAPAPIYGGIQANKKSKPTQPMLPLPEGFRPSYQRFLVTDFVEVNEGLYSNFCRARVVRVWDPRQDAANAQPHANAELFEIGDAQAPRTARILWATGWEQTPFVDEKGQRYHIIYSGNVIGWES